MTLQDLLSHYETATARGESLTPEEACREHPELLDQFRLHARALQIAVPGEVAMSASANTAYADETASRFTVLKAHARGGLGEVYLARDEMLGREVALKVMTGPGEKARRKRFEREAAITGRLQHPGIVPIYGTGTDDRGRPCHAMRFVSGPTLAEAIETFQKTKTPLVRSNAEFRQLLTRLVQVAQTVAFAHSRGVVHRDLKPTNIILGDYGETLVVDWGLAKEMRTADFEKRTDESIEDAMTTNDGAIVGTPAFLSPEQARGEEVSPASDLFALGGLLYSILTGAAPYSGFNTLEILERSREASVPSARSRRGDVPPALEAVSLRAMARNPADRFPDALAFASEIERFLADEPLQSAADPFGVRLRRWTRRHKLLVASGLAALVVAAIGSAIAAGVLSGKNQELSKSIKAEQEANKLANEREQEAFANFKIACDAVDQFTLKVNDDPRLSQLDLEKLKKSLLESAAVFYRQLAERRGDDVALQKQIANAHAKLAIILINSGDRTGAEAEFRKALARLQALPPDRLRLAQESAAWHGLCRVLRMRNAFDDGLVAIQKARATLIAAIGDSAPTLAERFDLATLEQEIGSTLSGMKADSPEAEAAFETSAKLGADLHATAPEVTQYWLLVPTAYKELGLMKLRADDAKRAEQAFDKAMAFTRALPKRNDVYVDTLRHSTVELLEQLSRIYADQRRFKEADAAADESQQLTRELLVNHPTNAGLRSNLASSLLSRGYIKNTAGEFAKGEALLTESLALRLAIFAAAPEMVYERHALINTRTLLARSLLEQKKWPEAIEQLTAAVSLLKEESGDASIRVAVTIGWARIGMGHPDVAEKEKAFDRAIGLVVPMATLTSKREAMIALGQLKKVGAFNNAKLMERLNGAEFEKLKELPQFAELLK